MKNFTSSCLVMIFLTGCSFAPGYQRPQVDTPAGWSRGEGGNSAQIARDWWRSFASPELNTLIDNALADNNDLLAGIQRVEQARAGLKIAGAGLLPSAIGSGGVTRSFSNPAQGGSSSDTSLRAGLDVSYELDLFGANRANVAASVASLQSAQFNQEALKLVVMADVAQGYFNILNLRERLAIADGNLINAKEVLRIIEARVREGVASDLELSQQRSSIAGSEASRASLLQQIANAENALAVLLGKAPRSLDISARNLANLVVPAVQPQQPSTLVERRPDIRAAEAGLIAANANIGAARAAYFPSVSLGAGASLAGISFADPVSTGLSLASSLAVPIFQGGRIEGGVEQATARQKELVENYRKAVLVSFQEVEDALAAVDMAQEREIALQNAMKNARNAYRIAKSRYDNGAVDYQTLLDIQNAQFSAEDGYSQARLARLTASVFLFKALGGGWLE